MRRRRVSVWVKQGASGLMLGGVAGFGFGMLMLSVLPAAGLAVSAEVMLVVPVLASSLLGAYWDRICSLLGACRDQNRPDPGAAWRLSSAVVVAVLLLASEFLGFPVIERAVDSGESSDLNPLLACLAFVALCVALAAPFSAGLVSLRRDRDCPQH